MTPGNFGILDVRKFRLSITESRVSPRRSRNRGRNYRYTNHYAAAAAFASGAFAQQTDVRARRDCCVSLQYCACHNPGAALTRRFRLSFSPRSPAIWTSRGNAVLRFGQFAGRIKVVCTYTRALSHTHIPRTAAILADAIPRPTR